MKAFMSRKVPLASQRGASAVEFAIVLPVLLLLLFGTIEFGVLFFNKAVITNASREGARRGVVWWTDSNGTSPYIAPIGDIQGVVDSYCIGHLISFGATNPAPTTTVLVSGTAPNEYLQVHVAYNYTFLIIPKLVTSIGGPLTLVGDTTMRIEF